jgi:hypothetical protein
MSDDLRDKFGSDEEYEEFRNSYDDYKNRTGMFDQTQFQQEHLKMVIKIEELIYKNFVLERKKFFRVPDELLNVKYMSLYMFHLEEAMDFEEITSIYLN